MYNLFILCLQQGPGVSEMMAILGKKDIIDRLNKAC
jgi:hypothetical protein